MFLTSFEFQPPSSLMLVNLQISSFSIDILSPTSIDKTHFGTSIVASIILPLLYSVCHYFHFNINIVYVNLSVNAITMHISLQAWLRIFTSKTQKYCQSDAIKCKLRSNMITLNLILANMLSLLVSFSGKL